MRNCACKITETTSNKDRVCPDCRCYRLTKSEWIGYESTWLQEFGKQVSFDNMAYYDGEPFPTKHYYSHGIILDHNDLLTEIEENNKL